MKIKTFDVNTQGRDFVCGDLHGSHELLVGFMGHVGFDFEKDRMFSVGDLVDRGPHSFRCLSLLLEPWFHCVKSNHEQLMEDFLTGGPTGAWWFRNGGNWFEFVNDEEKHDVVDLLLPIVEKLPWLITVNMSNGKKFHVIHAEILGKEDEVITDESLVTNFKDIASRVCRDGHGLLWGREMFAELFAKEVSKQHGILHKAILSKHAVTDFFNDKLSHIFSGHTPVRMPTTVIGQTNIDTMAFAVDRHSWAGLTVTEPLTGKFWKTDNVGTNEIEALVL
jgi:serine/threonine protein phosphatase 1